jgi:hypothetical protein
VEMMEGEGARITFGAGVLQRIVRAEHK